ncbi:TIGR04279 domain-containing protein [Methanosarcina sp.]|uniref:TIGR04279 domain-containing protein n=1 Tax=Methanosarcina sp. TaxID=2213 RepID=UPI003BB70C3C
MKKRTDRCNEIHCRKWRVIWTILIIILSLISVSATGSGNGTDSHGNAEVNLKQKIGASSTENKLLEQNQGDGSSTDNPENTEEELEPKTEDLITKNDKETDEEELEPETEDLVTKNDKETNEEELEPETEDLVTKNDKETNEEELEPETEDLVTKNDKETDEEELEPETEDLVTKNDKETNEEELEPETEDLVTKNDKETDEEELEPEAEDLGTKNDKETNEEELEPETEDLVTKNDKETNEEELEPETEDTSITKDQKTNEENLKLKTKADNMEYSSGSFGAKKETKTRACGTKSLKSVEGKIEQKSGSCNGVKSLKSVGVKPEIKIKTCNGAKSPENEEVKTEVKQGAFNSTYSQGTEEATPEVKPEGSSWSNMKLILAYPYSIHSFYTTQEKVEIRYKGPAAFGQQKVNIYLVKESNLSFPTEAATGAGDENTISFEDIVSKNTESYIEMPMTLNEDGSLSPLSLGPLPAGSYWAIITLAGNETKTPEPEKEIISADYFEVLEYEMEAEAPATIEEDGNFEVNLTLKNAPAQDSYTYWAVLIKEDAYMANINTSSSEAKAGTETFLKGFDIIKNFGIDPTKYGSISGKDELKSEIQNLIGEGNGTISIGEENQSTLSLTSLGLPPGDYLLFAGAYEKDKGLAGLAQKELTIYAARTEDSDSKSYSRDHNSDIPPSIKSKAPVATLETKSSILETAKAFGLDDLQPHIQGKALVEVIKNPPKIPSFLIGFAGTLLIGLVILKMRR